MAGYERSGLARREYCRRRGVPVTTFDYYRLRWNRKTRLVPVEISAEPGHAGSVMTLILANSRRIEVSPDFAEAALARLLRVAERA
jgi:hypothetical protein